jgi:hypothetical protein
MYTRCPRAQSLLHLIRLTSGSVNAIGETANRIPRYSVVLFPSPNNLRCYSYLSPPGGALEQASGLTTFLMPGLSHPLAMGIL